MKKTILLLMTIVFLSSCDKTILRHKIEKQKLVNQLAILDKEYAILFKDHYTCEYGYLVLNYYRKAILKKIIVHNKNDKVATCKKNVTNQSKKQ